MKKQQPNNKKHIDNKIYLIHDQMSTDKILTLHCTIPPFIPTEEAKPVLKINPLGIKDIGKKSYITFNIF